MRFRQALFARDGTNEKEALSTIFRSVGPYIGRATQSEVSLQCDNSDVFDRFKAPAPLIFTATVIISSARGCRATIAWPSLKKVCLLVVPWTLAWFLLLPIAISYAMARDGSSGGVIRLAIIDETGVERRLFLEDSFVTPPKLVE